MIQLNLLPDIKLEYIKAQKMRRLVTLISIIVGSAAIVIFVILIGFGIAQKKHISDINSDVSRETNTLQSKPGINQELTVQSQLGSINTLHSQEPAVARLFSSYLDEVTPEPVSLSDLSVDFGQGTINITGAADTLATVNEYVDTLKYTTFTVGNSKTSQGAAFTNVVLSSFGFDSSASNKAQAASFTITLGYTPEIFDITQNVTLSVPAITVTRSQVSEPGNLFNTTSTAASSTSTTSGGQ
jgi:hypothetical protein